MTLLLEALLALFAALVVVAVLTARARRKEPWDSRVALLLVVFLTVWAVGRWVGPVAPAGGGVAWIPIVAAALVVGLLLATLSRGEGPIVLTPTPAESAEELSERTGAALDVLFWILVAFLLALVVLAGVR